MKKWLVVSLVMLFSTTILFIALPASAANDKVIAKINFNKQCHHTTTSIIKALREASRHMKKVEIDIPYKSYSGAVTGLGTGKKHVSITIPNAIITVFQVHEGKVVPFLRFVVEEKKSEVRVINPKHLEIKLVFSYLDMIVDNAFKYLACK